MKCLVVALLGSAAGLACMGAQAADLPTAKPPSPGARGEGVFR